MKQRGFINLDGLFPALISVGAVVGILLFWFTTWTFGFFDNTPELQAQAIKHGCGRHNPTSGDFEWIQKE